MQQALEWLFATLKAGPRQGQEMDQQARAQGISVATLRRAREQLGITIERRGFEAEMRSWWHLDEGDSGDDTGEADAGESEAGAADS